MKWITCEPFLDNNTAGSQAREDVVRALERRGWSRIDVQGGVISGVGHRARILIRNIIKWASVLKTCSKGDRIVIQYPLTMGPKISVTAVPFIRTLRKQGVRVAYLIHDLDSLRGQSSFVESTFLRNADGIIAHNKAMVEYLKKMYPGVSIVALEVFDYLLDEDSPFSECDSGIDIAGNLSPAKAGYIYKLADRFPNAEFNLFGPNFNANSQVAKWYRGSFSPVELALKMHGRFGLVWDGDDVDCCSGCYGEYLRINNPHKLSMLIAIGKPILIWNEAAEAEFVVSNGIGFACGSIKECLKKSTEIDESEYSFMLERARKLALSLRKGDFTSDAVERALMEVR